MHWFDVNIVWVVCIHYHHVVVAGSRGDDELSGLVCEDFSGIDLFNHGVTQVSAVAGWLDLWEDDIVVIY